MFISIGTRYSFGVFYVAILGEYGWGRAETAGAFSLAMVNHALFAPVTGTLIDRFGPRALFPLGATFLVIGLVTASRITAIWHLYLFFGAIVAIGINTLSVTSHMALIPKWFIRKRGLASGLVLAGVGVGTMVLAPLIQFMIDSIGWRGAFLMLAGIVLAVIVPMTALLHRRSPEEVGQYPDGIIPGSVTTLPSEPTESCNDIRFPTFVEEGRLGRTLCTAAFWWMALLHFSVGFLVNMLVVHQAAYVVDAGYSTMLAASLVGFVGLFGSAGGILCGFISDRVGREIAYTLGASAALVGVLFFLFVRDTASPWMLYVFVVLYGLGSGSLGPVSIAAVGDLFPVNLLGRILGTHTVGFGFGGALAAYVGGYFYDRMGSYTLPFLMLLVSIGVGVLGIWMATIQKRKKALSQS